MGNKTDLVSKAELATLEAQIAGMNAMAKVHRTRDAAVEMSSVLGVNAFDLTRALEIDPDFLGEDAHRVPLSSLLLLKMAKLFFGTKQKPSARC